MRKTMRYLLRFIALSLLALPLTACSLSGEAIDGQVLEEGTNKPVAGAIVVVRWTGNNSSGLVHGQSVCYHVETATSDAAGKFHIDRWSDGASMRSLFIVNRAIYKEAYKPGYTRPQVPGNKLETVLVAPFIGSPAERLEDIVRGGYNCGLNDGSDKNLVPFFKAQYEEAKSLAATKKELDLVDGLLAGVERLQFGDEIADQKRQQRRLEKLKEKQ